VRLLREKCPDVLVGTPGRLNDLLENHGLAQLVRGLTSLVFDEADQLLEMGFRPAIGESHLYFFKKVSCVFMKLYSNCCVW
jgi:superfamily II DNA/RNA helicase